MSHWVTVQAPVGQATTTGTTARGEPRRDPHPAATTRDTRGGTTPRRSSPPCRTCASYRMRARPGPPARRSAIRRRSSSRAAASLPRRHAPGLRQRPQAAPCGPDSDTNNPRPPLQRRYTHATANCFVTDTVYPRAHAHHAVVAVGILHRHPHLLLARANCRVGRFRAYQLRPA